MASENHSEASTDKHDYDKFRDGPMRYLGYANELGESFRPLVPRWAANSTYLVAAAYVLADTNDKAERGKKEFASSSAAVQTRAIRVKAADCLIWQTFVSPRQCPSMWGA